MSLESRKNKYVFHSSISEKHHALKLMFSISTLNKAMCHKWVSKHVKQMSGNLSSSRDRSHQAGPTKETGFGIIGAL